MSRTLGLCMHTYSLSVLLYNARTSVICKLMNYWLNCLSKTNLCASARHSGFHDTRNAAYARFHAVGNSPVALYTNGLPSRTVIRPRSESAVYSAELLITILGSFAVNWSHGDFIRESSFPVIVCRSASRQRNAIAKSLTDPTRPQMSVAVSDCETVQHIGLLKFHLVHFSK